MDSLTSTYQTSLRNEAIGTEIMSALDQQRKTIVRTGTHLATTDGDITRSQRVLDTIHRRVLTNKAVLVLINVCLILILGITIYLKSH